MPTLPPDIVYVASRERGYSRKKLGNTFVYYCDQGKKIADQKKIDYFKSLVIPPSWKNVWICKNVNGHIMATGYDQRKRLQYIYHPKWVEFAQKKKFDKIERFGWALPSLRQRVNQDLSLKEWSKQKVAALIIKLLDDYHLRIGNSHYSEHNETYGATTLRRRHLELADSVLSIQYTAKSGKKRRIKLDDKRLAQLVKRCSELRGHELFRYKENGRFKTIESGDVNDYLKNHTGEDFSSKNFRTWAGTALTLEYHEYAKEMVQTNTKLTLEATLIKRVSQDLANTPAVCRNYYIHPVVLEKALSDGFSLHRFKVKVQHLSLAENAVLSILDSH